VESNEATTKVKQEEDEEELRKEEEEVVVLLIFSKLALKEPLSPLYLASLLICSCKQAS